MKTVQDYRTLIFDCDGVVLHSNQIKTEAFYRTAQPFGEKVAQQLVDYHVANGGVSRYKKFAYLTESLLTEGGKVVDINRLLSEFSRFTRNGLLQCDVANGLIELREMLHKTRWLIVSGGDQAELRDVFLARNLYDLFDGGIYGSPDAKETILARELSNNNIRKPALFLGDSVYDYQAASHAGLDFVFISQWTEFVDWRAYCEEHNIPHTQSISTLFTDICEPEKNM